MPNSAQKPIKPFVHGTILLSPKTHGSFFVFNENDYHVKFDWGDGNQSFDHFQYGDICIQNYKWNYEGVYYVKVKTYNDIWVESEWSDELKVTVKKGVKNVEYPNGLGYTAIYHNCNSFDIHNLTWEITFGKHYENNFGVLLSGRFTNGSVERVPPLGQVEFNSQRLFGFGYFGVALGFGYDYIYDMHCYGVYNWTPILIVGPLVYNIKQYK